MKYPVAYIFPHSPLTEKMHFRDGYIPGVGDVKFLSDKNAGQVFHLHTSGMHFRGVMFGMGAHINVEVLAYLMSRVRTEDDCYFQLHQEQKDMLVKHVQGIYQDMVQDGKYNKYREKEIRILLSFYTDKVGLDLGIDHTPIPYSAKAGNILIEDKMNIKQVFLRQKTEMAHKEDILAVEYEDLGVLIRELRHIQQMISGKFDE